MARSEMFKTFLCQKTVLDTFRAYIDVLQHFIQDLHQGGLIDKEETHLLKTQVWPSNRNTLMQMLVKRTWDRSEFGTFCTMLEKTQDADLVKAITNKADEYFKERGIDLGGNANKPKDPQVSMIDNLLMGMSMKDQTRIRRMLKEKEEQIIKLKKEEEKLENQIGDLTSDNSDMNLRLHALEKASESLVMGFKYEEEQPENIVQGLGMVKTVLDKRQSRIKYLEQKLTSTTHQLEEQKEWTSDLTTNNIKLKAAKESLEKELAELNEKYNRETFDMSNKIEESDALTETLQKKVKALETYYSSEIGDRDEEIQLSKKEIAVTEKMKDVAVAAKEDLEQELAALSDRVKALLTTLGLEHELKNLDLSIDYSAGVKSAKKRGPQIPNKPKLDPISKSAKHVKSDEELFNQVDLPWGNTAHDIQRRRDSVSIEQMFPITMPSSISIEFNESVGGSGNQIKSTGNFASPRKTRLPPLGEH